MINGQSYYCGVIASNVIGDSPVSGRILVTPNTGPTLALLGVKSRKNHLAPTPFDLPSEDTVPDLSLNHI